jgi:nicotinamide-nucleotide amidase
LRLRLTVWGTTVEQVKQEADTYSKKLYELVSDKCIAKEDITIETLLGKLLSEKKKTVATAESCTGGYIAHLLTSNPKSSSFFTGSVVCYSARIKSQVLGVSEKLIQQEGTVAEEVAKQLAQGILRFMQSDFAIAVTGLMGPDDGGEHKPVGTVWIAVGNKEKIQTKHFLFRFNRKTNIEVTAVNAMNELRKFILENEC